MGPTRLEATQGDAVGLRTTTGEGMLCMNQDCIPPGRRSSRQDAIRLLSGPANHVRQWENAENA